MGTRGSVGVVRPGNWWRVFSAAADRRATLARLRGSRRGRDVLAQLAAERARGGGGKHRGWGPKHKAGTRLPSLRQNCVATKT